VFKNKDEYKQSYCIKALNHTLLDFLHLSRSRWATHYRNRTFQFGRFGLADSVWPFWSGSIGSERFRSGPFRSRDISVWPFRSGNISVTTFLHICNLLHSFILN